MAYGDLKVRNLIWNTGSGDNTVVLSTLATQSYVTTNFAPKANPTFTGTINGADLVLSGNLTVSGTQTIINTNVLQVEDKHIEIGKVSSPSDTTADGGGIILKASSDRTFLWVNSTDAWTSSEHIQVASGKTFIGDGSTLTALNASNLASGTVPTARLGTGTASSSNYLRGDGSWQTIDLSAKASLSGATFTGNISLGDNDITNVGDIHVDKIEPDNGVDILLNMGTDKNISFRGNIGEIGDVTGFQAVNNSQSALTSFGIRATDIRFATGSAERFRVGSSGQLGIAGATYGSSGQVLTSGGASAAPSWTTISSAPEISAVASGALVANKPLILKTDGKVEQIVETAISAATGSAVSSPGGDTTNQIKVRSMGSNRFLAVWQATNDSHKMYAAVATVSGTTISFGSATRIGNHENTGPFDVCYDSSVDAGFICYYTSYTGQKHGVGLTFSGTTISKNNTTWTQSTAADGIFCTSDNNGGILIAYNNGSGYPHATIVTIAATGAITTGNEVDTGSENTYSDNQSIALAYDSTNNVFAMTLINSGQDGKVLILSRSGATLTSNSWAALVGGTSYKGIRVVYDADENQFLCVYRYTPNSDVKGTTFYTNGAKTGVTVGTSFVLDTDDLEYVEAAYSDQAKKAFVYYKNSSSNNNTLLTLTASGGQGGSYLVNPNEAASTPESNKISMDALSNGKIVLSRIASGNVMSTYVRQIAYASTNLTASNFIGFASAGYSNGDTATVLIDGSQTTQSSLTPASIYYVQSDGTIAATADSITVKAGVALSSTKLLIKG